MMNTTIKLVENSTVDYQEITNNNSMNYDFPEPYQSIRVAVNWAIIGLVLMSFLGNTLIIIVMSRKQNRNSSTSVFFTALAVSDTSIAVSVSLERWLHWIFGISLYGISPYLTKMKIICTYANIQISSWMLVCITMERALSIAIPYKIKELSTKTRARVLVCAVCAITIGLNTCGFTLIVDVHFDESRGIIWDKKVDNGDTIIAWMDFTVSFCIPIGLIIIGSVYIVIHLLRISIQKHATRNSRNSSVTKTILAANIVFVATMSPFVFLHLIYPSVNDVDISLYLFWTLSEIFMFLSDSNAALNFFVYVLSGSRFRKDVKQLLGCQTSLETSSSSHTNILANAVHTVSSLRMYSVSSTQTPNRKL